MVSPGESPKVSGNPSSDDPRAAGASSGLAGDGLLGRLVAGKFEIVELLGSGAMGAVYRAEQVALDKHVALKILHPSLRQDPTFVRRFHREAKAAAALEHPNSVSILDFGEEPDGLLYIAMEYLDGRDLFQVIQEDWPLSKERIVTLMRQVCGAVARAHDTGVVHRDLKPENIMVMTRVGDDGEHEEVVKVCDFGIAHLQKSPDDNSGGGKGLLVGTPEYMAPEVARGEEPDGRSDLYALGVVLYQILTKRLPFEGSDPLRVAMQHVQEEPAPPHQLVDSVDSYLEDVALMAMAKSAENRFGTARQMRGALRAALENREYSAADLSGVLSVLPPNVAARLVSSASLPPPAPSIPGAAPLPALEPTQANTPARARSTAPPATPMNLVVSDFEKAPLERDEGEDHALMPPPAGPRARLPWVAAASAAAVVGLAGFMLVARNQSKAEPEGSAATVLTAEPTPVPTAPTPAPAVERPTPTPVSLTSAPVAAVQTPTPAPATPPATTTGAAHAAKAASKPASKAGSKPSKEPDLEPDEHEPAPTVEAPAPPAPTPSATAKEPASASSGGLPPTWGGGGGGKESNEATE